MVEAWRCMFVSSLFKYFPATYIKDENGKERNYALESIRNNTLWASIPDEFNDLFECDYYLDELDVLEEIKQHHSDVNDTCEIRQYTKKVIEYSNRAYERIKRSFGITCFSQKDVSLLMWGHYANNHRGICIEYFWDAMPIQNMGLVDYNREIMRIKNFEDDIELDKFSREILFRKSQEWAYEDEVRVIAPDVQLGKKGREWHAPTPKSIRLGVKADESLKAEIKGLCKEKGIELYQMKKVPGQYAIEKIKIEL